MSNDRKPYRITRGSLSRRDGPTSYPLGPDGKRLENAKPKKAFVHYSAKTALNPDARDEIELTDAEARAFGLQRLARLTRRNIIATPVVEDLPPLKIAGDEADGDETSGADGDETPETHETESDDEFSTRVKELLHEAERITGMAETAEFRRKVERAGVLSTVPKRKAEIIEALRSI